MTNWALCTHQLGIEQGPAKIFVDQTWPRTQSPLSEPREPGLITVKIELILRRYLHGKGIRGEAKSCLL